MNKKQKIALWIGIAILIGMAVYPPMELQIRGSVLFEGYKSIFNSNQIYQISLNRLLVQYIVLVAVIVGVVLTLKNK